MLELIIPGIISLVITVVTLSTNSWFHKRARKHDFHLVTYESLESENRELRQTNYQLQQDVLESKRIIARLESDVKSLTDEKDELVSKLDELTKELLASREREFQVFSEMQLMKKRLEEHEKEIATLKNK